MNSKTKKKNIVILSFLIFSIFMCSYFALGATTNQILGGGGIVRGGISKTYNSITRTAELTDGSGNQLMMAQLQTPQINHVMRGKDRLVAEINVTQLITDGYTTDDILNGVSFYDVNDGSNQIDRNYTYKISELNGIKTVPTYITQCLSSTDIYNGILTNTTTCTNVQDGTQEVPQYTDWKNVNQYDALPDGEFKLGLFADVLPNDDVEFVPSFYSTEVTDWAEWVDSYNDGLQLYWGFNEGNGAITFDNSTNNNTGILQNSPSWVSGLIGTPNALQFTEASSNQVVSTNNISIIGNTSRTLCAWTDHFGDYDDGIMGWGSYYPYLTNNQGFFLSSRHSYYNLGLYGTNYQTSISTNPYFNQQILLCGQYNGTAINVFFNGNNVLNANVNLLTADSKFGAGCAGDIIDCAQLGSFQGIIDEVMVWNRSLSDSEISALYTNNYTFAPQVVQQVTTSCPINPLTHKEDCDFSNNNIYSFTSEAGAGLGIFLQYFSNGIVLLLIGIAIAGILIIVGYSIAKVIRSGIQIKR